MIILVTGSNGFIGKHLVEALRRRPDTEVIGYDLDTPAENLERGLREADVIYHLAGVNRPQKAEEFKTGNADFTESLCSSLSVLGRRPLFVLSSSIQAALDNPYGVSKRNAEEALQLWAETTGGSAVVFRLKNVFGKWCRPNYNSVTATFCHNIAHDLPISISDPSRELDLVYIDDVIAAFLSVLDQAPCTSPLDVPRSMLDVQPSPQLPSAPGSVLPSGSSPPLDVGCSMLNVGRSPQVPSTFRFLSVERSYKTTLGELADKIRSFRASRRSLVLPSFGDEFTRCLYATYLSYLDGPNFAYALEQRTDNRGTLAEFMKSAQFGQLFVSRTKPGITRGNHYHHTKTEKFLVVEGEAVVWFRPILGGEVIEHRVSGREFKVVDIPPGYAHSIENVGAGELVTLFWASEIFDPTRLDTYPMAVIAEEANIQHSTSNAQR
jgi:UDP-2-acetamido-2,6-beta-L-arabino-hexul-4-ose reductase